MSQFIDKLLSAKAAVANQKSIAQQALPTGIDKWLQNQQPIQQPTGNPIVSTDNRGVSKHQDGTYSFVDAKNRYNSGLSEEEAASFGAYVAEDKRATEAGAPISNFGNRVNAFGQSTVDLGVQGASAFTGDTTLEGKVATYNFQDKQPLKQALERLRERHMQRGKHARGSIFPEDIAQFRALGDDVENAESDDAFRSTDKYKKIAELDAEAKTNKSQFDAIEAFGKDVKSAIPVNRKDQIAAHAAFKVIAKNEGNLAAAWNAITEDIGTFAEQGIDSIPFMIAFTAGGPVVQATVLGTLAIGKGNQAVEEFRTKKKRAPSQEELGRIKAWAAASVVAEKFGDMLLTKAIPIAKLKWAQGVKAKVDASLPASIANLAVVRPVVGLAGEGVSGAATEVAEQFAQDGKITDTGEIAFAAVAEALGTPGGVAGMVTGNLALKAARASYDAVKAGPRAEALRAQLDAPQTVADTPEGKPIQDRIDEINALNENTSNRPMARRLLNVERDQLQDQLNAPAPGAISPEERAEAQRKYDALPSRVKPRPVDISNADTEDSTDIIENASPVENATSTENNLPISPEDFTKITANLSFSKTTLEEDIKALLELNERDLNAEQNDEYIALHAKATEEHNKYIAEISDPSSKKTSGLFSKIFRNIGTAEPLDESSIAELNKIIDSDATPSVVEHAKELLELTEAAVLVAKTMAEVGQEVISGTTTREKGFDTYIAEIDNARDIIANSSDDVEISLARKTIEKALSSIKTHSDNMVRKSKALTSALEAAESTNTPHYVEGNKAGNYNWESNREIDYTLVSNENIEENETRFANRDSDYFYKIDNTAESNSLVNAVNNEASYGQKVLNAAISNIKLVTEESQNSDKSLQQLDLLLTNAAPKTTVNKSEVVTGTNLDAVNFSEDNASAARREAAEQGDQGAQNNLDALTETPTKKSETESVAAEQKRSDDLTEPPAKETKTGTPTENTDTEETKAETPAKETKAETPSPANKTEVSDVDSSATATNAIATSEYAEQLVDLLRNQEATNTTVFDTASDVITKDTEIDSRNDKQIEDNLPKDMANAKDQWLGLLNDIDSINKVIKCMF